MHISVARSTNDTEFYEIYIPYIYYKSGYINVNSKNKQYIYVSNGEIGEHEVLLFLFNKNNTFNENEIIVTNRLMLYIVKDGHYIKTKKLLDGFKLNEFKINIDIEAYAIFKNNLAIGFYVPIRKKEKTKKEKTKKEKENYEIKKFNQQELANLFIKKLKRKK